MKKVLALIILSLLLLGVTISFADEAGTLNVIGVNNNYPYIFMNINGEPDGFVVDLLKIYERDHNVNLNIKLYNRKEAMTRFESGEAIVYFDGSSILMSPSFSKPSISFSSVNEYLYTLKDNRSIDSLNSMSSTIELLISIKDEKIAIKRDTIPPQFSSGYLYKYLDLDNIIFVDTYSEGLNLLSKGVVQYALTPKKQADSLIIIEERKDLVNLERTIINRDVFLIMDKSNFKLHDSINKALLDYIRGDIIKLKHDKWFYKIENQSLLGENLITINAFLLIILGFIGYLFYNNKLLESKIQDRTNQLQVESEKNKRLYDELVVHEKFKDDYFVNLSHELRTPLNVILSAAQVNELYLEKKNFSKYFENSPKYNAIIKNNSYRLLRVVNNLIDISKLESNDYILNIDLVDIVFLLEELVQLVDSYVKERGLTIDLMTNVDERIIECDPFAIERVFMNLISNSIKFTEPGGSILIKVEDNLDFVDIKVIDTGIGIEENDLDKIFDRYAQVHANLNRKYEGNGIGLSLVRKLITLHGGEICVSSIHGKGSTFTVSLMEKTSYHAPSNALGQTPSNHLNNVKLEFSELQN